MIAGGCIRPAVDPHLTRVAFRMHAAAVTNTPIAFDLRESGLIPDVKDQGSTGSCEGHACSGATEAAFALAGTPLGYTPSEEGIYTGARAVARARSSAVKLPSLRDEGALTEDAISFMATFGVRARATARTADGRNSDVEPARVNAEPFLGDLEQAAECLVVGPYAIDPTAPDAEALVQAALYALLPVRVDALVDTVYQDWTPSKAPVPAPNTRDPSAGGHAQYIVGYRRGLYIVRNSWGTTVGDAGDWLVSPAWLRASWALYPWLARKVPS